MPPKVVATSPKKNVLRSEWDLSIVWVRTISWRPLLGTWSFKKSSKRQNDLIVLTHGASDGRQNHK